MMPGSLLRTTCSPSLLGPSWSVGGRSGSELAYRVAVAVGSGVSVGSGVRVGRAMVTTGSDVADETPLTSALPGCSGLTSIGAAVHVGGSGDGELSTEGANPPLFAASGVPGLPASAARVGSSCAEQPPKSSTLTPRNPTRQVRPWRRILLMSTIIPSAAEPSHRSLAPLSSNATIPLVDGNWRHQSHLWAALMRPALPLPSE